MNNVTLIVGNGFDLSLGYKTRYSDFLKHEKDNDVFDEKYRNNSLYEYLNNNHSNKGWVDIENDLYSYYDTIKHMPETRKRLKREYEQIKESLKTYLTDEIKNGISNYSIINDILVDLMTNENNYIDIINFNYTTTVIKQIEVLQFSNIKRAKIKHYFIHGSINDKIVFGIDDKSQVTKDSLYLLKSFDQQTNNINLFNTLLNSHLVIFFGFSFGVSDESYYRDYFLERCKPNKDNENQKKHIIIYYHTEKDYYNLFYRLKEITNHNTAQLFKYNRVEFICVSNIYRPLFKYEFPNPYIEL